MNKVPGTGSVAGEKSWTEIKKLYFWIYLYAISSPIISSYTWDMKILLIPFYAKVYFVFKSIFSAPLDASLIDEVTIFRFSFLRGYKNESINASYNLIRGFVE